MIFEFDKTKAVVERILGRPVGQPSERSFEIDDIRVNEQDFGHKFQFENDLGEQGVFYVDENDNYTRGFLYKYNFRYDYGNGLPKFHICRCETFDKFSKRNYTFTTQPVFKKRANADESEDLKICLHCRNKMQIAPFTMTSTEFVRKYLNLSAVQSDGSGSEFIEYNFDRRPSAKAWTERGYSPDWGEISRQIRRKCGRTCQNCDLKFSVREQYYLDCHHLDGDKQNNEPENIQCLCVLCHANVNKYHQTRFSAGTARKRVLEFCDKFGERLTAAQHPYLNWVEKLR